MSKIYFTDINPITEWSAEASTLTWWVCPRKWWSIKEWKIALDFRKNTSLVFMKKESK